MKKDNKEVKKTDYGEDYNRESMYETVREALSSGENVVIDGKIYKNLEDVMLADIKMEDTKAQQTLKKAKEFKELGKVDEANQLCNFIDNRLNVITQMNNQLDELIKKKSIAVKEILRIQDNIDDINVTLEYLNDTLKGLKRLETKWKGDELSAIIEGMINIVKRLIAEKTQEQDLGV